MTFPKVNEVYQYNTNTYIVRAQNLFFDIYVQDCLYEDENKCSSFKLLNWWSFILKAKHIGSVKMSKAY